VRKGRRKGWTFWKFGGVWRLEAHVRIIFGFFFMSIEPSGFHGGEKAFADGKPASISDDGVNKTFGTNGRRLGAVWGRPVRPFFNVMWGEGF